MRHGWRDPALWAVAAVMGGIGTWVEYRHVGSAGTAALVGAITLIVVYLAGALVPRMHRSEQQ